MKNLAYIFILFLSQTLWSQSPEELFNLANSDFRNGKYQSSILQYEKIIKEGFQSAELYFNLGNANYKLNKIAPSIYYFEKALLIDPQNEDAKNNLAFAQRMTIDHRTHAQNFFSKNQRIIYISSLLQYLGLDHCNGGVFECFLFY